ncbi:MAG: S9 family peptidase [Myxococcales bacterium]|nr:S9 family peptidase [Myxococcales bacterium]
MLRLLLALSTALAAGGDGWKRPPPPIERVLLAAPPPTTLAAPGGEKLFLLTPVQYPPLSDLAVPYMALAGRRIDPRNGAPWGTNGFVGLATIDVKTGRRTDLALPEGARVLDWTFSADGRRLALAVRHDDAIRLYVSEDGSRPAQVANLRVNVVLGGVLRFMPDQRTLAVLARVEDGSAPPLEPPVPFGPFVSESSGASAASTYEARDLLRTSFDDQLFSWWATSRVVLVDTHSGKFRTIGQSGPLADVTPSPDGKWLLVERLQGPWSHRTTWDQFTTRFELWDLLGNPREAARRPMAENVPIHGVPEGPRSVHWQQNTDATLVWTEALDGGDPTRDAQHRDRLMARNADLAEPARELFRAAHRVRSVSYGDAGLVLVEEYERERRWRHVWTMDARFGSASAKPWFDLSVNDDYADPGRPLRERTPDGRVLLVQDKDALWFTGDGASPKGDRPFLDRRVIGAPTATRVFRSAPDRYERFIGFVGDDRERLLVRSESETSPPGVVVATTKGAVRDPGAGEAVLERTDERLYAGADPTPELRRIEQRIVTYEREDGVPLSFHLYLPPDHEPGKPLPTVVYAYPREYSDPATAGQVQGSDHTFLRLRGPSHLFYLLDGYAVLDQTAMPVLGDPDTAYDTFVDQLVMDARAAIAKAVEIGVTDPRHVGVIGHSHGGLMVATLLAHSDLFEAGVARSGAYNHTIRPFGYQNERRTLWEAQASYLAMSPTMFAPQLEEPILIVHGAADQNPGTIPFQSERLYDAVRGTGGTARLVMLPYEGHGYVARESVEHVLAEQLEWFDRYVK